ncbi:MAG: discoidin domain-containing protein [Candidatus Theseobacter exili]|nr:discoidin domain-containing protein [Candidatus Theseobacter exili]
MELFQSDNVGVSGYRIFRNGSQIAVTGETTYSDTQFSLDSQYTYSVIAYDASGNISGYSIPAIADVSIINLSAESKGGSVYNFSSQANSGRRAAANLIDGITKKTSSGGAWSSGKYPSYSQKIFIELSDTAILTQINFYMKGIEDKTKWPKYVRIYGSEYPDSSFSIIKKIKINKATHKQKFVMPNTGKAIKYVKIRIKSNHGHRKYVRLSEVKIKGVVSAAQ